MAVTKGAQDKLGHLVSLPPQVLRLRRLFPNRLGEILGVSLFYLIVTLVLTYPLAFVMGQRLTSLGDAFEDVYPLRWVIHQLFHDPVHLYDTTTLYPFPTPLAYNDIMLPAAVMALPFFWLSGGNSIATYNGAVLTSFVLSGLGMYLFARTLLRDWLPASPGFFARGGALLAGMLYTYCAYRFCQIEHLALLEMQWLPLALLALRTFVVSGKARWAIWFGVCMWLQTLSSLHYGLFLLITSGLYLPWLIVLTWRKRTSRAWLRCCGVLFVILAATGFALAPFILTQASVAAQLGFERSLNETRAFAARPYSFWTVAHNNLLYRHTLPVVQGRVQGELALYPGFVTLFFAAITILWLCVQIVFAIRRRFAAQRRDAQPQSSAPRKPISFRGESSFFIVLIGLGLFFSLGPYLQTNPNPNVVGKLGVPLPYLWFYEHFSPFKSLRTPARFMVLAQLGLSVLAGFGFALVGYGIQRLRLKNRAIPTIVTCTLFCVAALFAAAEVWEAPIPTQQSPAPDPVPPVYTWLAAHPDGGPIYEVPGKGIFNASKDYKDTDYDSITAINRMMYYATIHWHPLVNGKTSFIPDAHAWLINEMGDGRNLSADQAALLQGIGVRYFLFHKYAFTRVDIARLQKQIEALPDHPLTLIGDFESELLYSVAPITHAAPIVTFAGEPTAHVNAQTHIAITLHTQSAGYAWLTYRLPKTPSLVATWRDNAGQAVQQNNILMSSELSYMLPPGPPVTYQITLPTPTVPPGVYTLELHGRSDADYPFMFQTQWSGPIQLTP